MQMIRHQNAGVNLNKRDIFKERWQLIPFGLDLSLRQSRVRNLDSEVTIYFLLHEGASVDHVDPKKQELYQFPEIKNPVGHTGFFTNLDFKV